MNVFKDKDNRAKFNQFMLDNDHDGLYNFVYQLIKDNPNDVLNSESDHESRKILMGDCILYFTETEEYEKCEFIQEMLTKSEAHG